MPLPVDLYRVNTLNPNGWTLVPLDPQTLADLPSAATPQATLVPATPRPFARPAGGTSWVASADGSTFLRVDSVAVPARPGQPGWDAIVRDAVTGRQIASLRLPWEVFAVALSADGNRLVLWNPPEGQPSVTWYVVDLATARIITTIAASSPTQAWWPPGVTDPTAHRLYTLPATSAAATPTGAPHWGGCLGQLVAYDLGTGKIVARRNIRPGLCDGQEVQLVPALAVSPDGAQVADVAADGSLVTLLRASDLTVERTIALTPTGTPADQSSRARGGPSGFGVAAYASDGKILYLTGATTRCNHSATPGPRLCPLRRLDLRIGKITAENPNGAGVLVPAPNGRDLYAYGSGPAGTFSLTPPMVTVRRLEARTRATRAERTINEVTTIVVRPVRTAT